jgi:hypothetical protein
VKNALLPPCFTGFPGAVLLVSPDDRVIGSNGRLEVELGRAVIDDRFSSMLDGEACGATWARARDGAQREAFVCDLVVSSGTARGERHPVSVMWDSDAEAWSRKSHGFPRRGRLRRSSE